MGIVKTEKVRRVENASDLVDFFNDLIYDFYPEKGSEMDVKRFTQICYWGQNISNALSNKTEQQELEYLRQETKKLMKLVEGNKPRNLKVV